VALAPADEYFGPLKMSVLGIRNEIHDLAIRYDVRADIDHALAKKIMGTAVMTEASLADWEKKYPGDDQLARDVYLMQHLYAKIEYDEARDKAKYCAQWLLTRYSGSWYAKNLRLTMARDHIPIPSGPPTPIKELQPAASASAAPPASSPAGSTATGSGTTTTTPGAAAPTQGTGTSATIQAAPTTTGAAKPPPANAPPSKPSNTVPPPSPPPT